MQPTGGHRYNVLIREEWVQARTLLEIHILAHAELPTIAGSKHVHVRHRKPPRTIDKESLWEKTLDWAPVWKIQ